MNDCVINICYKLPFSCKIVEKIRRHLLSSGRFAGVVQFFFHAMCTHLCSRYLSEWRRAVSRDYSVGCSLCTFTQVTGAK